MRILEQTAGERVICCAGGISQGAWEQAGDRFNEDQCGQLTAA